MEQELKLEELKAKKDELWITYVATSFSFDVEVEELSKLDVAKQARGSDKSRIVILVKEIECLERELEELSQEVEEVKIEVEKELKELEEALQLKIAVRDVHSFLATNHIEEERLGVGGFDYQGLLQDTRVIGDKIVKCKSLLDKTESLIEELALYDEEEKVVVETKVFHIDQCSPPINFAEHKSYHSGMNGYEVVLSSAQVDKINEMDFDCNHSNNRNQNLNTLKALLGEDIERKRY